MFTNHNNVGRKFHVKDRIPDWYLSKLVYFAKCCGFYATYIGQTNRRFPDRIKEHYSGRVHSAIYDHSTTCNDSGGNFNFQCIRKCFNSFDLITAEAIYIRLRNPSLNVQLLNKLLCV